MRWLFATGLVGLIATYLAAIWTDVDFQLLADSALPALAVPVTIFTVRFGFWSKWWTSQLGKLFLIKSILLTAVLWQATAAVWVDADYPHRHEVRLAIYGLAAVAYWGMVWVLRSQQQHRGEVTDPADTS